MPKNLVNESRREKRDKERERDIYISREERSARSNRRSNEQSSWFPFIEGEKEKDREGERESEKKAPWMPPGETPVPRDAITKGVIIT